VDDRPHERPEGIDADTPAALGDAIIRAAQGAQIGVAVTELDTIKIAWVSDGVVEILGRPREEILTGDIMKIFPQDELVRMLERRARRARGESAPPSFETAIVRPDGTRVPILVSIRVVEHLGRRIAVSFIVDLTEQQRSIEQRDASEARFRDLVEAAPDGIAIVRDGTVVYANPAAVRMVGAPSPAAMIGLALESFMPAEHAAQMRQRIDALLARGGHSGPNEYQLRKPDGSLMIVEATAISTVHDGAPAVLGLARDVTERVRQKAQLARADRLAALGTLAAGVAHEINNPLTFVGLGLDALARLLDDTTLDPASRKAALGILHDVRAGADRVASIVRDLRIFAHPREDESPGPVDLGEVLATAGRLAANEIRPRARLVDRTGPLPPVRGDARKLEQVFVNLLVNAAQALEEGATGNEITIAGRAVGEDVVVDVRDNGPGMTPEVLRQVFDPFFTTKAPGVGTGLGLSICHGIISQFGGDITIDSAPGQGTTVRIRLVRAASSVEAKGTDPPRSGPTRSAKILVVDDEPALLASLRALLGRDHEVTTTSDPHEAVEWIVEGRFDLVLCDLAMPGLSGADVHARVAERRPDQLTRLVFMTGGAFTPRLRAFLDRIENPPLEKPFAIDALDAVVVRALRPA
jgi:PAS domain S-box-containing protein